MPRAETLQKLTVVSGAFLIAGMLVFRRLKRNFADYL
jgi:hypothetical protein